MRKKIRKVINIPEKTQLEVELVNELPKITVNGPLGSIEKNFKIRGLDIKKEDNNLIIEKAAATKKDRKMIGTIVSHVANMIAGVNNNFEYKLQICSIHFPISIKIDTEKNLFIIKNFLGENKERAVKLLPGVDVSVKGEIITLKGHDKEIVAQCAADIETATKIKAKDRRVFQDGIFIISKAGKKV